MRKMKDSGIPWIGEIPENWVIRPVKELYRIKTGFTPNSKDESLYDINGATWVTIADLKSNIITDSKQKIAKTVAEQHKNDVVSKGSLLYSFKLSVGTVAIAGKPLFTNEAIAAFTSLNENEGTIEYLKYASFLIEENSNINIYGAKILNQKLINNAIITVPPSLEQRKIAKYLDEKCKAIDSCIEQEQQLIEKLTAYKQSLITETVTKGLNPEVPMKDSGIAQIGCIPNTWGVEKLKYLLTAIVDCPHATPKYSTDGHYLVIRTADQGLGRLRSDDDMYRLDYDEYQLRIQRMALQKDDVVYGREGERWGLACLVPQSNRYCLGQRMMHFRCDTKVFLPAFAVWALNSQGVYQQGYLDAIGSTTPHVNISTIRNFAIPLPSMEDQKRIAEFLDTKCLALDTTILKHQQLIDKLQTYKKSLIYEVVTGKREVV